MRNFNNWIFLLIASMICAEVSAQSLDRITMTHDGFSHKGGKFYPVTMNYISNIVHDNSGGYYVSPCHSYGADNNIDCFNQGDCKDQLVEDFEEIIALGFNSIRITGMSVGPECFAKDPNNDRVCVDFDNKLSYFHKIGGGGDAHALEPNYTRMKGYIQTVLDAMDEASANKGGAPLKLIYLAGKSGVEIPATHNKYIDYLKAIATHFKNNPTFMAFDFYNEPGDLDATSYTFDKLGITGIHRYTKKMVCEMTKAWNDAVKSGSQGRHLTTIGNMNTGSVLEWDPAVQQVDFPSFHFYPRQRSGFSSIKTLSFAEPQSHMYWFNRYLDIPWTIGETGFAALAGILNTYGTQSDQAEYAEMTLDRCRDCGGKGYSWWAFQDVTFNSDPDKKIFDKYGLKRFGDPSNALKQAASKFVPFNPNNVVPSNCVKPPSYYNFYLESGYTVTGHVQDQNGDPVKGAVVVGWDILPNGSWTHSVSTFADDNGNYTLQSNQEINVINASFLRANVVSGNVGASGIVNLTLNVKTHPQSGNLALNGTTNNSGANETYEGVESVITQNHAINSGANVNIKAGKRIHLKPGFHAKHGSDADIYIGRFYVPCNCYDSPGIYPGSNKKATAIEEAGEHDFDIKVYPNPGKGLFQIDIEGENVTVDFEVFDASGRKIYEKEAQRNNSAVDLTTYPQGLYYLKVTNASKTLTKKLIVQ